MLFPSLCDSRERKRFAFPFTVYNVGGTGQARQYNADVIGADHLIDIAIIKLTTCIPQHPFLCWGRNRETLIGSSAFVIGNTLGEDSRSFSAGILRDNRYIDPSLPSIPELVATDAPIGQGNSGGPLLDSKGCVVGVINSFRTTIILTPDLTVAISQYVAERVIKDLLQADVDCSLGKAIRWIEKIPDIFGPFLRRVKSYLNLGVLFYQPYLNLLDIETFDLNVSGEIFFNKIIGILIFEVPQDSPFIGILVPGDIITHINACEIGLNSPEQVSVGTALLCVRPGDSVKIRYRKISERYRNSYKVCVTLLAIPIDIDFIPRQLAKDKIVPNFSTVAKV